MGCQAAATATQRSTAARISDSKRVRRLNMAKKTAKKASKKKAKKKTSKKR